MAVFWPVFQEQWDCPLEKSCKRWTVAWLGPGGWAWSNQSGSSWGCRSPPSSSPPCPSRGTRSREARRCGAEWGTARARTSASARRRRWPQGRTYARRERNKHAHKLAELFHQCHHQQRVTVESNEKHQKHPIPFLIYIPTKKIKNKKISIFNMTTVKLLCDLC